MKELIIEVVNTGKLSQDQLLQIGNSANDSDVWKAIKDLLIK